MIDLKWEDLTTSERWRYVNQDFVRGYELLPKKALIDIVDSTTYGIDPNSPEELKSIIIDLYEDGKDVDEIAYHVPCSIRHIQRILKDYRDDTTIRDKILGLYHEGLTKKQIMFKLQCSMRHIHRVIRETTATQKLS